MFELGDHAEREHQKITSYLEDHAIGRSYLIGENFFKTSIKSQDIQQYKSFNDLKDHLMTVPFL